MKKPSLASLLRKVHEDEEGTVSLETILIIGAIALPILIFLIKVGWPTSQDLLQPGADRPANGRRPRPGNSSRTARHAGHRSAAGAGRGRHGNRPAPAQDLQLDDLHRHPGGLGLSAAGGRLLAAGRVTEGGIAVAGLDSALREPARAGCLRPGDVAVFRMFRVGGGDVKLIAMLGAFLGLEKGIEAMLWTFVLGGCMALIVLVWRVGPWRLAVRVVAAGHVDACGWAVGVR